MMEDTDEDLVKLKTNRDELLWICQAMEVLEKTSKGLDDLKLITNTTQIISAGFLWFATVGHTAKTQVESCRMVAAMLDSGIKINDSLQQRLAAVVEIDTLIASMRIKIWELELSEPETDIVDEAKTQKFATNERAALIIYCCRTNQELNDREKGELKIRIKSHCKLSTEFDSLRKRFGRSGLPENAFADDLEAIKFADSYGGGSDIGKKVRKSSQ